MITLDLRICLILASLFIGACAGSESAILKYQDTQFLDKSIKMVGHGQFITISGLVFHSALAVDHIETRSNADRLDILVYLTPTRGGLSGSFTYTEEIPQSTNVISFGAEKEVIWRRE
jgi:hypothetical protein